MLWFWEIQLKPPLNPVAVQRDGAFGRVQGCGNVGRAGLKRNARESYGLVSILKLAGRWMRDGNTVQRHPRARQAVAGVQAQRLGGTLFAPLDQGRQCAVEQALSVVAHGYLPLQQAAA